MNADLTVQEGFLTFRGHQVWYQVTGDGEQAGKLPLLCLHGGPGAPHDYLQPLAAMAQTGRRVVFYDQLGCGKSDRPSNPSMWTVELFVEEIDVVRDALGLDKIHLLGQSWGGMLAMEYLLTEPSGVASLTLASSLASAAQWAAEANRLRAELPADVQQTLHKHEEAGTTDDPAYEEATMALYSRYVCRIDPFPDYVMRTFEGLGEEVYNTMWGPTEFNASGTLKDWDIRPRLGEISLPTLVTSGRYDEATPLITATIHDGIPGSQWVIFEASAHMAHAEEAERYMQVLGDFLSTVENAG